jgi:hypothetical protein
VLIAAGVYEGQTLAAGDNTTAFGDGSFSDFYYLFSTRPCTITLRSPAFDAYLGIVNPSTQAVVFESDDIDESTTVARVSLSECHLAGLPLLIVANHWPGPGGAYTLTVEFDTPGSASMLRASASAPTSNASVFSVRTPSRLSSDRRK